ncbi:MAG: P-II family nitrogen regulator [Chloroflexi bacterium]|nr:P-II family nitrogen regulator [Chloroflexota bacterium]
MKKVECIIRPQRLEDVKNALDEVGVFGLTVTEVRGCGQQKGVTERYRGIEYTVTLLPKVKVEMVITDEQVEPAIEAISRAARTGEIGDGKIFVLDVLEAVRIRTQERASSAL